MRFLMLMIPNVPEDAWMPDPEAVGAMTAYNQDMERAGVLLAAEGLHPTSAGARLSGSGGKVTIVDGPFTEAKEIIGGYWLIEVASRDEAIEWARRCPAVWGPASVPAYEGPVPVVEVRQIFDVSDYPQELREAAERTREE